MNFSSSGALKRFLGEGCFIDFVSNESIFAVGFDKETYDKLPRESKKLVVPTGVTTFFDGKRGGVEISDLDDKEKCVFLIDTDFDANLLEGFDKIVVDSVFDSVVKISNYKSEKEKGKLVAITGTVGKTTTKRVLGSILKNFGTIEVSSGNISYPILKKIFLSSGYDYGVFEISGQALSASRFIVRPDVAILTSVGEGHLEEYGDVSSVFDIKARIFGNINLGGTAIVNRDIPYFSRVKSLVGSEVKIVTYGESPGSDYRLDNYDAKTGTIYATLEGKKCTFNTSLLGRHNAINLIGALAVSASLGIELEKCIPFLKKLSPPRGRGDEHIVQLPKAEIKIINESYNANPLSMRSSIESFSLREISAGRKVLVLGDMLELGENSLSRHKDLSEKINSLGFDRVYLVGENMAHLWPEIQTELRGAAFTSYRQILPVLRRDLENNDNVLFKSSNGVGLNKLVSFIVKKYGK
ncbi:Mur ligase family protein [Halomonas sp. AOP5-B2-8]